MQIMNQTCTKANLQDLLDRMDKELSNRKKNVLPLIPTLKSDIAGETENMAENLMLYAYRSGIPVTFKHCNNFLEYYFYGLASDDDLMVTTLDEIMYGEGSTWEEMALWLDALNVLDLNGIINPTFIDEGFGRVVGNKIKLTIKGIDFVEAMRHIYRTVGYKLVSYNYPTLTVRTHV